MTVLPDGTIYRFSVEWGRTSPGSLSVYDVALYDAATFDGAGVIGWTDASGFTLSVSTRRGKDAFGKRFRTGSGRLLLDNSNGRWSPPDAGFQPGDFVRIQAHVTLAGVQTTGGVFYGRVDSSVSNVRGGADTLNVQVNGLFGDWAVIDQDAQAAVGAGDTTQERMSRLFTEYGFDFAAVTEYGTSQFEMQATTLAQPALQLAQITMDSEGGDFAELPDGSFMIGYQDWLTTATHTTEIQWTLGGIGIGIDQAQPSRQLQLVVNDASVANVGGSVQQSTDATSQSRFGRRTTRRLDLIGDSEAQSTFLANRIVANLKDVRPRVREVTVQATDQGSADFCQNVKLGDLIRVTVDSINSWGSTFLSHVIGIDHATAENVWAVSVKLDDAFITNVDGGFSDLAFSAGFQLGTALLPATGATEGAPGVFTPPGTAIPLNFEMLVNNMVVADPQTRWAVGSHVILGDDSHAWWDATAWQVGDAVAPPSTGANEGTPGVWTPIPSVEPFDFGELIATAVVANPQTLWAVGSHMVLGDASQAYWDSSAWQTGASPAQPSRYTLAGVESVQITNFLDSDIDSGFTMDLSFQVDGLPGTQVVAGAYGSSRRFALDVTVSGQIRFAILQPSNQFTRIISSVAAVPGVTYHAILQWTPSVSWSLNIDGTVNNGTPPAALRAGTNEFAVGRRTNNTEFMTGFVEAFTLTPISGRNAELLTADSGVGNINGATWSDQYGTGWIANGDVIASGG